VERKVKATVLVDADVLSQVKRLVGKGRYRSLNACVNEALRAFLEHERRVGLESEMEEASRDEMFLRISRQAWRTSSTLMRNRSETQMTYEAMRWRVYLANLDPTRAPNSAGLGPSWS